MVRHTHRNPTKANLAVCQSCPMAEMQKQRIEAERHVAPDVAGDAIRETMNELPGPGRIVGKDGGGQQATPRLLVVAANDQADVIGAHRVEEAGQIPSLPRPRRSLSAAADRAGG